MKFTRVASTIVTVLVILVTGVAVTTAIFGERLLAAVIEKAGPAMVGREVRVGDIAIDWGRFTTVAATELMVADAAWSASPAMLRVRHTELAIDLLDLLRLRLSPVRLSLHQPVLHLARSTQGRWNLPRAETGGSALGNPVLARFAALREIEVENGEVIVDDLAVHGVEGRITTLLVHMQPVAGAIGFNGMAHYGGGTPIAFSGEIGSIAQLLRSGDDGAEPFPISLTLGPETARLSATGHLVRPLDLDGFDLRVRGQGSDLTPLLAAFSVAPADTTPPFHLTAHLMDTERGWELKDVAARLGASQAGGKAAISFGQQQSPRLSMDFVAPRVVLSDLDWLASIGGQHDSSSGSVADASLPTGWLHWANASGDLRVERLEGLAADPADLRVGFEVDRGHLRVQPLRLGIAQGVAEGTATVDTNASASPLVRLRVEAADMHIKPLLAAFGITQVAGTLTTASVDLRGQGTTLREVTAALNGAAHFRIVDGSLDVPNLSHISMGLVETLGYALGGSDRAAATPVTCAVGDFPVRQGVVHAERLAVLTPRVMVVGEGTVHLDEATVRLTLVPRPLDEAMFRVVVPVVISGTLLSPEMTTQPELRAGMRSESAADICRDQVGRR